MADRVFLHIGLPKTGTTYLQSILWGNRDRLRESGLFLPGSGHREHLWAALDVQEHPSLPRRHANAVGTWERLCAELEEIEGTGLISHEFFGGASAEQAHRAIARLAPAQVHLIITARDAAGVLAGGWQEQVKNGNSFSMEQAAMGEGPSEFSWQTWDLAGVLERWTVGMDPSHVHVLPIPGRSASHDQHWRHFAQVLGVDPELSLPEEPVNTSLGVVQVQLMRRINQRLSGFGGAFDRGRWVRGYLAEERLGAQDSERFRLSDALLAECSRRTERAVALIEERGFDVVGDLSRLRVDTSVSRGRMLDSVTDAEVADAGATAIAAMLEDVRRLTREVRGLEAELDAARNELAQPRTVPERLRARMERRRLR